MYAKKLAHRQCLVSYYTIDIRQVRAPDLSLLTWIVGYDYLSRDMSKLAKWVRPPTQTKNCRNKTGHSDIIQFPPFHHKLKKKHLPECLKCKFWTWNLLWPRKLTIWDQENIMYTTKLTHRQCLVSYDTIDIGQVRAPDLSPLTWIVGYDYLNRDMSKLAKWVCAHRRLRSAWASAQSDQSLRCALNE